MFVTSSRKKSFAHAVVKFDVDGLIATIKTSTIEEDYYSLNDKVTISWGEGKEKKNYLVEILHLNNVWVECKN